MGTITRIREGFPQSQGRPSMSVVIPALNEEKNLPHVAERMPGDIDEIIFVDGNPVDRTAEVARNLWPEAIHIQ